MRLGRRSLACWMVLLMLPGTLPSGFAQTGTSLGNPANDPNFRATLPTTSERLQQLQQQLSSQRQLSVQQKTQLEQLRAQVAKLGAQQRAALNRIDALEGSVARLETARRTLDIQIQGVQETVRDLDLEIQGTEARVERLKLDVRELLISLYRERSGRYLQLLSQASSLSDLLIRARYANIGGQNNVKVVQALKYETARLATERASQAAQAQQLQKLQAQQIKQLGQLQAQRQEQTVLVAQLKQNQAGQQALAVQTQAQQALTASTIQNVIGGIVQERASIEAERQARIRAEQERRAAELARIRAAQEAARREQLRLANLKVARDRLARLAQLARQTQLAREQQALQAQGQNVQNAQDQSQLQLAPLPAEMGTIGFPLPGGQVTTAFSAVNGWTVLSGDSGGQAVSVADGNVIAAANYANLGWVVIVNHGPISSAYFGLSQPLVRVGDRLTRGQAVGIIGGSPQFGPTSMALVLTQNTSQQHVKPPF